jgi:hypothetical protein
MKLLSKTSNTNLLKMNSQISAVNNVDDENNYMQNSHTQNFYSNLNEIQCMELLKKMVSNFAMELNDEISADLMEDYFVIERTIQYINQLSGFLEE